MLLAEIAPEVQAVSAPASLDALGALTATVHKEHEAAVVSMSYALEHAMAAGEALQKIKDILPHGRWLPWLRRECKRSEQTLDRPLSERTAQNYLRLAAGRPVLLANPQRAADLSQRGALELLKQKSNSSAPAKASRENPKPRKAASSFDALGWWSNASLEERRHFINGVGLRELLEATPAAWRARAENAFVSDLTPQTPTTLNTEANTPLVGNDCGPMPDFLLRRAPTMTPSLAPASPPAPLPSSAFDAERLAALDAEILAIQRTATQSHLEASEWRKVDRLRKQRAALQKPLPLTEAPWRKTVG